MQEIDNGYRGKEGDTYPAYNATSVTLFNNYPLENITENDGIIRFNFMGGVQKCEVSFYSNSAYGTCSTGSLTENSKGAGVVLPAVTPRSGYTFLGWATTKRGTTPDAGTAGQQYYPMSDCTLYALYRDDSNWHIDVGMTTGVNGILKGVTWEDGKTEDNKWVTDKVAKGKNFYIFFLPREGYNTPLAQNCQVRVTTGGRLIYVHSFVEGGIRLDFNGAELTGDIVIQIYNSREQKQGGCDPYRHTFTTTVNPGTALDFGIYQWDVSIQNYEAPTDYNSSKGASFGSGSTPAQQVHFRTEDTMGCAIESVTVNASVASQGDGLLNVYVGGNIIGDTEQLTENDANYTFTPEQPMSGALDIRLVNTQKAMYIKSINITYTDLPEENIPTGPEEESLTLNLSSATAIYNLLGQPMGTDIHLLPAGVYIICTDKGTEKIIKK